jgi:hypothetical protein
MPQRAIFDAEFVAGRAFANAARALGMTTHAISGDVTSLWYTDLYFCWQRGSTVIAGLTGASALFCLEKLAWDAGHRVVLRVDHAPLEGGGVKHTFRGPREMLDSSFPLPRNRRAHWGAGMARLAMQCPASTARRESCAIVTPSSSADLWCEPLVSWVIAPRSVA